MGKIDKNGGMDRTMERRHIQQMLRYIDEYEQVKRGEHPVFKTAKSFYEGRGICKQNFLKYYRRFLGVNRDVQALLPRRRGRRFNDILNDRPELTAALRALREKGYNRFDIGLQLARQEKVVLSPSTIYRLLKKLNLNRLSPRIKQVQRRIIKMAAGELGHIDVHHVAKGTVKETGNRKLYIVGLLDDYSRVCWLEVVDSIKALDVMFASMDLLMRLRERYGITFQAIMSDNGSEFASRNNLAGHPFERMLTFYGIKHRYTKPYRPQTNGKIERFWRTLEDELLDGEQFNTLAELREYLAGYSIYYNEQRTHQGIDLQFPANKVKQ